jgi:hypothetical protein
MHRVIPTAIALVALSSIARADESAVRLTVRPAAAPKPAMKYQLLPEVREINPGNAMQWYMRCFAEQRNFFFGKEGVAQRNQYRAMSLAELKAAKLSGYGGSALTQADWAARLDHCDWEVLRRVQTAGLDMTQPELGPLKVLAVSLQVRFRIEVASGNWDDAVRTAKTMFALARHLGEYPAVAANLAGISFAQLALDALEETVQQSGCPNFYWALTDLPTPLVELRRGVQGDRSLVEAELKALRADVPMTAAQLEEFVSRLSGGLGFAREQAGQEPRSLRAILATRAKVTSRVQAAHKRLVVAEGLSAVFQKFDPVQIILLDEKRDYETRRDERLKLLGLPLWQIDALILFEEPGAGGDCLFADLLPQIIKARREQGRLEQRIALLRHVEALRMYAADHKAQVPVTLADVAVPLPVDPFTGKSFAYKSDGATAHLQGWMPRSGEKNSAGIIRYEIAIKK